MKIKSNACLALLLASSTFAANFTRFDTTVTVKTFTDNATDSTFVKLRNMGLTLVYVIKAESDCPFREVSGDFELGNDPTFLFHTTNSFGDSSVMSQTQRRRYCGVPIQEFKTILPAGSKYQRYQWVTSGGVFDSMFTRVEKVVNDSTFTISISPTMLGSTTSIQPGSRQSRGQAPRIPGQGFTLTGQRIGSHSRISIDAEGRKQVDFGGTR